MFFENEAKDSEQVHIGAINCAPPLTLQREDFNTCRNGIQGLKLRLTGRQCDQKLSAGD